MNAEFDIQPETFVFEAEPGEFAPWQAEAPRNRGSPDYIRWLQTTLNQVLGLNLAIDGRMGPPTRSAIRSFQQRQGLAVDGVVGPQTEKTLIAVRSGAAQGIGRASFAAPGIRPSRRFSGQRTLRLRLMPLRVQ